MKNEKIIYADNAATTKLDMEAFEAMKPYLLENYANASQQYSLSREVRKALKESRQIIAKCIDANPDEIYFTSGGTESDNWAIKGIAYNDSVRKEIITSHIEHHAILNSCRQVERLGVPVVYLPANEEAIITPKVLRQFITDQTKLVSIMMANNEVGSIQPIKELCAIAHDNGAIFHTDAVQAVGHIPVNVMELGVDLLSASAHKFNGPKGVGFLYIKNGTNIIAHENGGFQERFLRAGTENVAATVGMAIALRNNCNNIEKNISIIQSLENKLLQSLINSKIDFIKNGSPYKIPGNISLSFKDIDGEVIMHRLDLQGICISTGAACDSVNTKRSHVIEAIKVPQEYANGTIRISLGVNNTDEEINKIVSAIKAIVMG